LFAGFGWFDLYPFNLAVFINFYIFGILRFVRKNEAVEVKKKSGLLFYFFLFTSIICLMTSLYLPGFNPHGRYYLAYFMTLLLKGYLFHNGIELHNFITGFIIKNIKYITFIAFFVIYISSINLLLLRYYLKYDKVNRLQEDKIESDTIVYLIFCSVIPIYKFNAPTIRAVTHPMISLRKSGKGKLTTSYP